MDWGLKGLGFSVVQRMYRPPIKTTAHLFAIIQLPLMLQYTVCALIINVSSLCDMNCVFTARPASRSMHASCAAFQGFNDLRIYYPATKSWTGDVSGLLSGTRPDMRYYHCLTSADGLLYVHGGIGGNGECS